MDNYDNYEPPIAANRAIDVLLVVVLVGGAITFFAWKWLA